MRFYRWDEYLQFRDEQKGLEKYQQTRSLPRPKTTKLTVTRYALGLFVLLGIFLGIVFALARWEIWIAIVVSTIFGIGLIELYGRLLAIKAVECYQHYAKEEVRRRCKCVPSCSEYTILCLRKYELFYALAKIWKRLFATCKNVYYILDEP